MIIGLCGQKGSGKDTVGAYLIKTHGFERKAFADPLKQSIAKLFNISFAEVDKLKNDLTIGVGIGTQDSQNNLVPHSVGKHMTFREFIQRYGTESHRDVFGLSFWVDQTLPISGYYAGKKIVVTDVRFENEVSRIHTLQGVVIKIERPDSDIKDPHSSEDFSDIEADITIVNNSTLDNLYTAIEDALSKLDGTTFFGTSTRL